MALVTGNQIHGTRVVSAAASVGTVDLVVLSDGGTGVTVVNDSGSAPIWFTVSHPGGNCPLPAVNGANSFCVASVAGASKTVRHTGNFGSVVQLTPSSGTPEYTVSVVSATVNA